MKSFPILILVGLSAALHAQSPQDAQALEARGEWPEAEAIWKSLTAQHPDDYRFWTSLGICLAHQNKFAEAIRADRKALTLNPKSNEAEFNLGLAFFKSGQLKEAIAPLAHVARTQPSNSQ